MTFHLVYDENYILTIPAVLIDNRANLPIANKTGKEIKIYTDAEVEKVVPGVITYKIENDLGNLAGYLLLKQGNFENSIDILKLVLRPQFQSFTDQINEQVKIYMSGGGWKFETL